MDTVTIVVLAIVLPLVLLPAALVWYLNIGGVAAALKEARARKRPVAKFAAK